LPVVVRPFTIIAQLNSIQARNGSVTALHLIAWKTLFTLFNICLIFKNVITIMHWNSIKTNYGNKNDENQS